MKNLTSLCTIVLAIISLLACTSVNAIAQPAQVEGHYTYEHAFNYDLMKCHLEVHETGTMVFSHDGSALDSARQVYTATMEDGCKVIFVFNYISPSRWRLEDEDFHFAGIKESFRMELTDTNTGDCDPARADKLAQEIIRVISASCDYEYKFHLDMLTKKKMQWSFTYRDGHSDTWEFYRDPDVQVCE